MSTTISWGEIFLRLALTFVAGALIGLNREEHGRPAGLRTTLLVCLAASFSMIQVNLLLGTTGKSADSFIVMDLMRLPLGILSGMGFIGAGAILHRHNFVVGVTTAATLWFATVMGLCFGGGQLGLGLMALVLGLIVLSGLKRIEMFNLKPQRGRLLVVTGLTGPNEDEISITLAQTNFITLHWAVTCLKQRQQIELRCDVEWQSRPPGQHSPAFLRTLQELPGVIEVMWWPEAMDWAEEHRLKA